jgi:hypothetical protein
VARSRSSDRAPQLLRTFTQMSEWKPQGQAGSDVTLATMKGRLLGAVTRKR